jgi:hypothetical protein
MSVNGMTVGQDYSFAFYDANTGTIIDLGDVQNVKVTAQKHDIKSQPYNGVPRFGYIPDGFKISFTITRTGQQLEDLQVAAVQRFNAGSVDRSGFLSETITNPDGSVSRYQYTGFCFFLTEVGDVSREKMITQQAEGMASDKIRIA